jgi:hypothetical protein
VTFAEERIHLSFTKPLDGSGQVTQYDSERLTKTIKSTQISYMELK